MSLPNYESSYPWAWWVDAERVVVIDQVPSVPPALSLVTSNVGPAIAPEGFGRVCFEFEQDGQQVYTPWIKVDVLPLAIPIPRVIRQRFSLISEGAPGVTIEGSVGDIPSRDAGEIPDGNIDGTG